MRGRALIIATSEYSDASLSALPSTEIDAQGLRQILSDNSIGDFQVTSSLNATCQSWREQIEVLFSDAGHDESLLLYISGHGIKDRDGRLYFAASDTRLKNLLSTGVSSTFIQDVSNTSRSRRIIMIFDTCFSGAFAKGVQWKSDSRKLHAADYFDEGAGKVVITASDALQFALAGESVDGDTSVKPSLFSKYLIGGLRTGEADTDGDGQVTTEDLYRYIASAMHRDGAQQRPLRWSIGVAHDFVIATNPAPKPGKVPDDVDELISNWRPEVRLVAIEKLSALLKSDRVPLALAARQSLERLAEDDSRTVASAAAAALLIKTETVSVRAPVETSPAAPSMPSSPWVHPEATTPTQRPLGSSSSESDQSLPPDAPVLADTASSQRHIWWFLGAIFVILVLLFFIGSNGERYESPPPTNDPAPKAAGTTPSAGAASNSAVDKAAIAPSAGGKMPDGVPTMTPDAQTVESMRSAARAQQQAHEDGGAVPGLPNVVYGPNGTRVPAPGYEWVDEYDPTSLAVKKSFGRPPNFILTK